MFIDLSLVVYNRLYAIGIGLWMAIKQMYMDALA